MCDLTKGELLGHSWQPADCTNPSQCITCGKEEGEALGHNMTTWDIKGSTMTRWCKDCTFSEKNSVDQDVLVRDHLLGTWNSAVRYTFNKKPELGEMRERVAYPQRDYSVTFYKDGTMLYITDREYAGTWELDSCTEYGQVYINLHCPEFEDIYVFKAVANGAGSLTVHEIHEDEEKDVNYEYHRDTADEMAQGKALLLENWSFTVLEVNGTTFTDAEDAYSVRFLEDGTAELHLKEELNAKWVYLVNQTKQQGRTSTYYRFGAFVPGEKDFYIIHLFEDTMRLYVYQNETNYTYLFAR